MVTWDDFLRISDRLISIYIGWFLECSMITWDEFRHRGRTATLESWKRTWDELLSFKETHDNCTVGILSNKQNNWLAFRQKEQRLIKLSSLFPKKQIQSRGFSWRYPHLASLQFCTSEAKKRIAEMEQQRDMALQAGCGPLWTGWVSQPALIPDFPQKVRFEYSEMLSLLFRSYSTLNWKVLSDINIAG